MKKEIPVIEAAIKLGDMKITLLTMQIITWSSIKGMLYFNATRRPVYAVLSGNGQNKVMDMLGQEVSIHQAKMEFPCLDVNQAGVEYPHRER